MRTAAAESKGVQFSTAADAVPSGQMDGPTEPRDGLDVRLRWAGAASPGDPQVAPDALAPLRSKSAANPEAPPAGAGRDGELLPERIESALRAHEMAVVQVLDRLAATEARLDRIADQVEGLSAQVAALRRRMQLRGRSAVTVDDRTAARIADLVAARLPRR